MSLIVTVKVPEGYVMAADSRVSVQIQSNDGSHRQRGISHYSDSFQKLFLAPNGAGISFCGEMAVENGGVNVYLERFLKKEVTEETSLADVAPKLLAYFKALPRVPDSIFHVAGFLREAEGERPCLWRVLPKKNVIEEVGSKTMLWDGEGDILARLTAPVTLKNGSGEDMPVPSFPVPLNLFTLGDAVDFARFAIDVTMKTMGFQLRPKTVGGAVDLLVLKPEESFWLQKKTLGDKR